MTVSINNASDLADEIARQTQDEIIKQLNSLISRNLLIVEKGPYCFVQSSDGSVQYKQEVSLKLEQEEYIRSLEVKIEKLNEIIDQFQRIIKQGDKPIA